MLVRLRCCASLVKVYCGPSAYLTHCGPTREMLVTTSTRTSDLNQAATIRASHRMQSEYRANIVRVPSQVNLTFEAQNGNSVSLDGWESEFYLIEGAQSLLLGRLVPDLSKHPRRLMHQFTLQRHLDLRNDDFLRLVNESYQGDVVFEFRTRPSPTRITHEGKTEQAM